MGAKITDLIYRMKAIYKILLCILISIAILLSIYTILTEKPCEGFISLKQDDLVSGQAFHSLCKYNIDNRYSLVPYDARLQEGDFTFLKVRDIPQFILTPPSKKVTLIVANNDETFDDHYMNLVRPYTTVVYAVNSSARDAIQIPLGFRDDQYTPHSVMIQAAATPSDRTILCLINFIMATNNGERKHALNSFTGKDWATISNDYITYDFNKSLDHSNQETAKKRVEYYELLKRTKFVICPAGRGVDTHRVYESLFFGCIPVIKSSFLDPMYKRLGGCWVVNDWDEVTEKECNRKWKEFGAPLLDVKDWVKIEDTFQNTVDIHPYKPSVSFITYGDDNFKMARERITREARATGVFNGTIKAYSPDDLSNEFKSSVKDVLQRQRGGGYWIWKPYIIYTSLDSMAENDILFYVDAGCVFTGNGIERLREYISYLEPSTGKSILAMRLNGLPENVWTSDAVFNEFKINSSDSSYTSNQILATISVYRKCPESMAVVTKWLNIAMTNPGLFTDDNNEQTKAARNEFKDSRHDQSIFSLILKSYPYNQYTVVIDDDVDNEDIQMPIKAMRRRT
jgi:hypothetical protein